MSLAFSISSAGDLPFIENTYFYVEDAMAIQVRG